MHAPVPPPPTPCPRPAASPPQTINRGLKRAKGTPGAPLVGRDKNAALNIGDCYDVVAGRAKEEHERPWYMRYREEDRRAAHAALLAAQA